jgi:hypothetical protein
MGHVLRESSFTVPRFVMLWFAMVFYSVKLLKKPQNSDDKLPVMHDVPS